MAQILIGGPPNTPPQILQGKTEEDLGRHIWGDFSGVYELYSPMQPG